MGFTRLVADYQGYVNAGLVRESSGEGESTGLNLWKPPEQGTIKFNSDAAFLGDTDVGLGVVGRNSRGEVVVVASKRCRARWSVETAEAKAMMFGLEVAKHLGVNNIALESDSMVAVRAVQKAAEMRHSFGLCVRDVCELLKSFVCRGVNHVKREGNTVAHLVARLCSAIDTQKPTFVASPQDRGVGEGSWAGLSFSPTQLSTVAVARSFPKCIDLYDQENHIRNLRTLWYPSSLTFVQSPFYQTESSVLAVTEGCQLTLWDLRMKENGGCIHRICGSPGEILYDSSTSTTGNIAVAGADRTVTVFDPRRWSVLSRWTHCSKYEITGLAFSALHPDYIYVQGMDYEVFCGDWYKGSKIISFRGYSSWLGFDKCPEGDVVGGWCDSGSIFVAHIDAKKDSEDMIEVLPNGNV